MFALDAEVCGQSCHPLSVAKNGLACAAFLEQGRHYGGQRSTLGDHAGALGARETIPHAPIFFKP